MKKIVGIIPVRLESTRLPGKPLLDICGLPMIIHVLKRTLLSKMLENVFVATDSDDIARVIEDHEGNVIRTSRSHKTGTDRIAEAASKIDADIIVNIQGDEALVMPEHIDASINCLLENYDTANVAILVNSFYKFNSDSDIKVVLNENKEVMYFSRSDIPSNSRVNHESLLKAYHVVPFKKSFLLEFASWQETSLEKIEFIEFMRILEKGYKIASVEVESAAVSVDTRDDLEFVRKQMIKDSLFKEYIKRI